MSYAGETFRISCGEGGLNHNPNIDLIQSSAMVHPSRNLNLDENARVRRGGTAHVYTSNVGSTTNAIKGIFDYRLTSGGQYLMTGHADGSVHSSSTNEISSSTHSGTHYVDFEVFENELFFVNSTDTMKCWAAASTDSSTDITSVAADWATYGNPAWITKHGRGASERMWCGGCEGIPQRIYASANGDAKDYGAVNVITIDIETGDGFGIIGTREFGDRLVCFGKNKSYLIDDLSTNTADWGYDAAQWEGGAASNKLITKTANDIVAMTEDGEIYSIVAAETYGDYKAASLTQASFIHRWIKEHAKLSEINKYHMIYDPILRAIKIFIMRNGQTEIDTALVYFIDRGPAEGWIVHSNQTYDSGYSACSSGLIRVSAGNYKVYTGGYNGIIWKLEETIKSDNGNGYYAGFRTPWINFDNPRIRKNIKRGWLVTKPAGAWNMTINWWVDQRQGTQRTVSLTGKGFSLGTSDAVLGEDALSGIELINKDFDLGINGTRVQLEVYNSIATQDFMISQLLLDYKPLGAEPAD